MAVGATTEPDLELAWDEVVDSDMTLPYWIHRAGYSDWNGSRILRHTHVGFAEIFWVESGHAIHEVNGAEHSICAGHLEFVDTLDVHRFRLPTSDFSIVNLAIPTSLVADVVERYIDPGVSPWKLHPPRVVRPAVHDWARVLELGSTLGSGRPSRLRVDHFLIELLLMLDGPVPARQPMPVWLSRAIRSWRDDPAAMLAGVSGIAELSARSREHVSRAIKQATGHRAIDVVNSLRIERAASMLRMSDDSITRIAADSGLPNLSHFYDVFKRHFGATPRQYRLSQRRATNPVL
jgi:AraC family transcriptional regulator, dual regulator of chb operon